MRRVVAAAIGVATAKPTRVIVRKGDIQPGAVTAKALAKGAVHAAAISKGAVHGSVIAKGAPWLEHRQRIDSALPARS